MKANTQLLIQTNSPGELSSWVTSVCETCKTHYPETEITLFLTPCQYATGQEKEKGEQLPLVKKVFSPKETIYHLLSWPWISKPKKHGAVLFLGGDPLYSQLLGLKHRLPIYGYTESNKSLGLFFKHTFTQKDVGHLMADRLSNPAISKSNTLNRLKLEDKPYTLFFSSSRPKQFKALFPLLCQTIQEIQKLNPDFYPIMNISPFITEKQLEAAKKDTDITNILFFRESSVDIMNIAKWLVTIPGTNTAEAAYVRLPMIVLIPLNHPELLIFDGIGGLIGKLPILGPIIIKGIIEVLRKKKEPYSQPNRLLKKHVVPELIEPIIPKHTAKKILSIIGSETTYQTIKNELETIPKPDSVSLKICRAILQPNQRSD